MAALYQAGFQWGVSVGFKPLKFEERRDERTGAILGVRFLQQELLEVSAVPVPANRNALRRETAADAVGADSAPAHAVPACDASDGIELSELLNVLRAGPAVTTLTAPPPGSRERGPPAA